MIHASVLASVYDTYEPQGFDLVVKAQDSGVALSEYLKIAQVLSTPNLRSFALALGFHFHVSLKL